MTGPLLASRSSPVAVARRGCPVGIAGFAIVFATIVVLLAGNLTVPSSRPTTQSAPVLSVDGGTVTIASHKAAYGPSPVWRQISTKVAPSPRYMAQIAYDARDGYTVLFGGFWQANVSGPGKTYNDTWTFRGGIWTQLLIPGPSPRVLESMAYDPADGYVVLFGGYLASGGLLNQTWIFSSGEWRQLDIAAPSPEYGGSLAWDPALGTMILSGGAPAVLGDAADRGTWSFVHGVWTNLSMAGSPPPAVASAMAYVPSVGGLIQFGGQGITPTGATGDLSGTWFFDGKWKNLSVSGPSVRDYSQMAFEPSAGEAVLFGGLQGGECLYATCFVTLGDTWTLNGATWTEVDGSGPPPRYWSSMVYDAADGYDLLFGGTACQGESCRWVGAIYNDTWAFSLGMVAPAASVYVTPSAVCVFEDHSCAAGTWTASVNVSVQPEYSSSFGGVAALTDPIISVLPWGEIELNRSSPPVVRCASTLYDPVDCDTNSTELRVGNATGFRVNWSSDSFLDSLYVGQAWSVQFTINVAGPPYGSVPVYACTTGICFTGGSGAIDGSFSCVSVQPLAPGSHENDSLPYANITVDPPRIPPGGSSSPITNVPPPPPPPTALPSPIALPSPVLVPTPVLVALAVGVPTISISAAAAGVLSAGVARVVLQRRAVAVGQPVGNAVRGKRSAFEDERPTDPTIGRLD
jgi:galactose oxidase-like protein